MRPRPRLYRRGRTWWCAFYDLQGQRHRVTTRCTDRRAAEAVAAELERRAVDPAGAAAHEATLAEALERLLADRRARGRAEGTLSMYRVKGGQLVRVLGEALPLSKVNARAVDAYIEQRLAEGAARNTVAKELGTLRAALRVALRRGEWKGDLGAVIPAGWSPEYQPRRRYLPAGRVADLLEALPAHRAAAVALILGTGARLSEALRAERSDVDLRRGVVWIRGTKTERSDDEVPILPWARELLELALRDGAGPGRRILRPWGNVRRDLAQACQRIGLDALTPNDLRRTVATWIRGGGASTDLVARMLRHTDGRMAERVYGRLDAVSAGRLLGCDTGVPAESAEGANGAEGAERGAGKRPGNVVPRDGIEPPTRGFSIPRGMLRNAGVCRVKLRAV